jgi:NAD(P)-dependent dehydrogenase (short-subunit alcohol dehydrogenase family)
VVEQLRAQGPRGRADFLIADLSVMSEVRRAAKEFQRRYDKLDVLINNASAIFLRRRETVEGIETTFALNYLAYFVLTNSLAALLSRSAPSRVINVASSGHSLVGGINFEDLYGRRAYRGMKAYHQSKLADVMFTYELARKLNGRGITVNPVDPGFVKTNIGRNNGLIWRLAKPLFDRMMGLNYVSPEEGARSVAYLAYAPEVAELTGLYFSQNRPVVSSAASNDRVAAERLWAISESLAKRL